MTTRTAPRLLAVSVVAAVTTVSCSLSGVRTEEQTYEIAEAVTSLIIDARAGAVSVAAGDGPVQVTEHYEYRDDKPRTSHQVDGSTLRLTETGCASDTLRCTVSFRIQVPAATAVTITTNAGAVELNDLDGDIEVQTDAGAVEAKNLAGDKVSVDTDAGATSLHFREPPTAVEAKTDLGAISVEVPRGTAYAVDATTSVGGAEITVDRDASSPHKITVQTDVGGIKVKAV